MSIVFKFVIAAGFFFALVVLRSVAIYSAWSVALIDGIARRVRLSHTDPDGHVKFTGPICNQDGARDECSCVGTMPTSN
jgi:hypothetical protein